MSMSGTTAAAATNITSMAAQVTGKGTTTTTATASIVGGVAPVRSQYTYKQLENLVNKVSQLPW